MKKISILTSSICVFFAFSSYAGTYWPTMNSYSTSSALITALDKDTNNDTYITQWSSDAYMTIDQDISLAVRYPTTGKAFIVDFTVDAGKTLTFGRMDYSHSTRCGSLNFSFSGDGNVVVANGNLNASTDTAYVYSGTDFWLGTTLAKTTSSWDSTTLLTAVKINKNFVLHEGTTASFKDVNIGGEFVVRGGTLELHGSNSVKNLDASKTQAETLVVKFGKAESNAAAVSTLFLGAKNDIKTIAFADVSTSAVVDLNGNEFSFAEFIQDGSSTLSFLDFAENLVKFTGDESTLSKNDDGSLKYIFAGVGVDSKNLFVTDSGYLSTTVPEPAQWAIILGSLALGLAVYRRRK